MYNVAHPPNRPCIKLEKLNQAKDGNWEVPNKVIFKALLISLQTVGH